MDSFTYKDIKIDFLSQQIYVNGSPVKLDPKAFETLKILITQKHRVVNNDELIEHVWENRPISNEVIVSAIARIRKLFKSAGLEHEVIRTIHKVGYKFNLDKEKTIKVNSKTLHKLNFDKVLNLFLISIIIVGL